MKIWKHSCLFQTLAVSVNLYAIIDAIQDLFGVSEHELMSLLKQILKNEVATGF